MVDDMMKEVLPWRNEEEKLSQCMEENMEKQGKKWRCKFCDTKVTSRNLMTAHFEKSHKFDVEEWAKDQVKAMKASFESFMKQVTGIGDSSGEFILPGGTKADMSQVKGVPDIRTHFQGKLDKGLAAEKVLDMYRKVDADEGYSPEVKELV